MTPRDNALLDAYTAEAPARDYKLYKMDVSHLYSTYDLTGKPPYDDLPLNSGHAIAYYAVAGNSWEENYPDAEQYIGTYWPASKEWVQDHAIDLMPHRATHLADLDGLYENEVVDAARKWVEKV